MNLWLHYTTRAFCFKDTDIDDEEEGKKVECIYLIMF